MPDADDDLFGAAAMFRGERVAQVERLRIAVPARRGSSRAHRFDRLRRRPKRALVRAQAHELALARLAHQLLGADERRRRRESPRWRRVGRITAAPKKRWTLTTARPAIRRRARPSRRIRRLAPPGSPKTNATGADAPAAIRHASSIATGTYHVHSARLRSRRGEAGLARWHGDRRTGERGDDRRGDGFENDERRRRIAGQAEIGLLAVRAEERRLARLDA